MMIEETYISLLIVRKEYDVQTRHKLQEESPTSQLYLYLQ